MAKVDEGDIAYLKLIVQKRARDLKVQGTGYLDCINKITIEMYEAIVERKKNLLTEIQAQGVDIDKIINILDKLSELATQIGKAIEWLVNRKAAKEKKMEELRELATPWVTDIYK